MSTVFSNIIGGISAACQLDTLLCLLAGTILGLMFGAIPGLNATLAMVLILPLTYSMSSTSAIGLLMGAYVGGITGGLISAITIGIPGTAASIATTLDGHPLSKRGESGRALGIASASSFFGGMLGWLALVFLTPQLSRAALMIGSFEYSAIILFGFTVIVGVSGDSLLKSVVMMLIGMIISVIGLDPLHGVQRLTFGIRALDTGFQTVPLLSGVYVVSRALEESENLKEGRICPPSRLDNLFSQLWKVLKYRKALIVSSVIGILVGILPGIGASVAPFLAYDQVKKLSKTPEEFGRGTPEGIVASEACNNATIGGALVPALALGIPGDVPVVILLSGLMLHGYQLGPTFFANNPALVYLIYAALMLANALMLLVLFSFGIRLFTRLMSVSKIILIPIIMVAGLLGAYNIYYNMDDVWVAFLAGLFAYAAIKAGFPLTPMIIAAILGPLLEKNLRIALTVSDGSLTPLFTRPISLAFILLTVAAIAAFLVREIRGRKRRRS